MTPQLCILLIQVLLLASHFRIEASSTAGPEDFASERSRAFLEKLNAFADDVNSTTSGLTFDHLRKVFDEARRWDEQTLADLKAKSADYKALIDFGINPMRHYEEMVGDDLDDIDAVHKDYFKRFEKTYKKFRPNYRGEIVGPTYAIVPKLSNAISSLYGSKDSLPLDEQVLRAAKSELETYLERIVEIQSVEDIYANLDELGNILNMLNFNSVRAFRQHVLPRIQEDPKGYPELAKAFRNAMAVHKVFCVDGVVKVID